MDLFLQHTPQPFPWGCQYYALYALLGDERLLEDVTECNSTRFEERARELGYLLHRIYADTTCTVPMPAVLWDKIFGGAEGAARLAGFEVPFIIDINSLRHRDVFHTVGLTMTGHQAESECFDESRISFRVFDPAAAGEKVFDSLGSFLDSAYGKVYELKQVMPLAHFDDLFPKHFGPDAEHVRPEVRQAYCQSLLEKEAA
ncbi:hypothetical protein QMK33_19795 [Hymenobacter sp. H14-R3]|uniref:hypothetical protein n=1 Tax=Hymenobacter sp. H14-R3 TaxID=3046308 RepID=UPI0024B9AE9B|nr:hypothetical protein [Hymenobacter sp. H14-R3]MDJ0367398.1 hypothetical protein [Hymenobacter sp. H14-R3]